MVSSAIRCWSLAVSLLISSSSLARSRCCLAASLVLCCVWTDTTSVSIAVIADCIVFTVRSRDVPDMLVCEVCASVSSMWVSVRVEFCGVIH